jgi:threonine/homoserine/homoserine lactone efflux protein
MTTPLFLKGAVIGFSIAMAIGPISLLCIRNSLTRGFLAGLATGLGAAVADGMYGAVAGFGITAITTVLFSSKTTLQMLGGLFLCYLGINMFRKKGTEEKEWMMQNTLRTIFATTLFLTLTNPMTIIGFIAIYAGLGVGGTESSLISAGLLTLGVFLGSSLWYTLLSGVSSIAKSRVSGKGSVWLNRVSGCIILGFGAVSLITA